jgi:hypothetical protein
MDVKKLHSRPENDVDYKRDREEGADKNIEQRGKKLQATEEDVNRVLFSSIIRITDRGGRKGEACSPIVSMTVMENIYKILF